MRESPACKVCDGASRYVCAIYQKELSKSLDLFACRNCGLVFVGTRFTDEELSEAYKSHDQRSYYDQFVESNDSMLRSARDLAPLLGGPGNSVLDLGCGNGRFLSALKEVCPSANPIGYEIAGCEQAAEARGFKVYICSLADIDMSFRAIALLDVAEHLPSPVETLESCYNLLEKHGYIYIHTPRRCLWDSLFVIMAKAPFLCKISPIWLRTRLSSAHLQLWTDQALRICLMKLGFGLVYMKAETELSWPCEKYTSNYLGYHLGLPRPIVRAATAVANVLFVRLGTLKNKTICLAQK